MSRWAWLVLAATGPAAMAADPSTGKQVFDRWCAECHARGPNHPGTQSLQVKYKGGIPAALEDRTDLTPTLTRVAVRSGVALMPYFRKTEISDSELLELATYLDRTKQATR